MAECTEVPAALAMPATPRQFALVLDESAEEYAECVAACGITDPVVWWGCEVHGRALVYRVGEDGRLDIGRHRSPQTALDLWERVYPLKLVWL